MDENALLLGTLQKLSWQEITGEIVCDDPELARFVERDWFRREVERQMGSGFASPREQEKDAFLPAEALVRPSAIEGGTGYGKSRSTEHLLFEQIGWGSSALLLDPKGELISDALALAKKRGIPPERVTLVSPSGAPPPGWNPLTSGLSIMEATSDVTSVLEKDSGGSWGPRMANVMTNAILVLASQNLSLYELRPFLTRDDYRAQLLQLPPKRSGGRALAEAKQFFVHEYDGSWTRSARAEANAPVLNKVAPLIRNDYLAPLLCARENTLDLSALWKEQRLILVYLDETALTDEGVRLLAGLFTNLLFRTAQRMAETPEKRKTAVVLALDELESVEHLIGDGVNAICTKARSMQLRAIFAFQCMGKLSDKLRKTLQANCDVRLTFRLGDHVDAKAIAHKIAEGHRETVLRCHVSREAGSGSRLLSLKTFLLDEWGRRLSLKGDPVFSSFWSGMFGESVIDGLYAAACAGGVGRLYVEEGGRVMEVREFLKGLRREDFWIQRTEEGVQLVIGFPRPKVTGIERLGVGEIVTQWTHLVMHLPTQHCVLTVAGKAPALVKVAQVDPPPKLAPEDPYLLRVKDRAKSEGEALFRWRDAEIERVARGGRVPFTEPEPREAREGDGAMSWEKKQADAEKHNPPPRKGPKRAPISVHEEQSGTAGLETLALETVSPETVVKEDSDDGSIF